MITLTENQVTKLYNIAIKQRLENYQTRFYVKSWAYDLYPIYNLCVEVYGKENITKNEMINFFGEYVSEQLNKWTSSAYDFWDIVTSTCHEIPEKNMDDAIDIVIKKLNYIYSTRSESCGLLQGSSINDLSLDQAIQLTAIGAIRWKSTLNDGKGGAVFAPLYIK